MKLRLSPSYPPNFKQSLIYRMLVVTRIFDSKYVSYMADNGKDYPSFYFSSYSEELIHKCNMYIKQMNEKE